MISIHPTDPSWPQKVSLRESRLKPPVLGYAAAVVLVRAAAPAWVAVFTPNELPVYGVVTLQSGKPTHAVPVKLQVGSLVLLLNWTQPSAARWQPFGLVSSSFGSKVRNCWKVHKSWHSAAVRHVYSSVMTEYPAGHPSMLPSVPF